MDWTAYTDRVHTERSLTQTEAGTRHAPPDALSTPDTLLLAAR